jgi:hypothetical protein
MAAGLAMDAVVCESDGRTAGVAREATVRGIMEIALRDMVALYVSVRWRSVDGN